MDGGGRVSRTTRGFRVEPAEEKTPAAVRRLILADEQAADYLICRPWNAAYWEAYRQARQEEGEAPTNEQVAVVMDIELEELEAYLAKEIWVAKPPELRADAFDTYEIDMEVEAWDGATLTAETVTLSFVYHSAMLRTVTDEGDSSTELQTIIPRWRPEQSVIYAARTNSRELLIGDVGVHLLDINADGRAWMKVAEE